MHALRHVHELLLPGGTLVDLHPLTEERVESRGRALGTIEEPDWVSRVLPNAEAGLRGVVREGLYRSEAELEFDLYQHFDTAEELIQAKWDRLELQPSLVQRIRDAGPPLVTHEHYVGRRLRAC